MKARRLFDADATDGYLLDGKYWIDPLITGIKTNADRVRQMTDEKLAEWLSDMHDSVTCPNNGATDCNPSCKRCWLDWLKQEAEDG